MIRTGGQRDATQARLAELEVAYANLEAEVRREANPFLQTQKDAVASEIAHLRQELDHYEVTRSKYRVPVVVNSFDELPAALVATRIGAGIEDSEFARKIGMDPDEFALLEENEYFGVDTEFLLRVAEELGISTPVLPRRVFTRARDFHARIKEIGLNPKFVLERLLPVRLVEGLSAPKPRPAMLLQAASYMARFLSISLDDLLGSTVVPWAPNGLAGVRFKIPSGATRGDLYGYLAYIDRLTKIIANAMPSGAQRLPETSEIFRREVEARGLTLESTVNYLWEHGIATVPLRDRGFFHAACWRHAGRNVIVLKQTTESESRWLFDLLHEVWHADQAPAEMDLSVIEALEGFQGAVTSDDEKMANFFAGEVLLAGKPEVLADECVRSSKGRIDFLKAVVPTVAANHGVDPAALANYMAYRLSLQDINWWGAAMALQPRGNPYEVVLQSFLSHFDLEALSGEERHFLFRALMSNS